jgi:hypothetical protein
VKLTPDGAFLASMVSDRQVGASLASQIPKGVAMKKPTISFRQFGGSGPLSVYWHAGPYGDAVEAARGSGVGGFTATGEALGVEFDDVARERDEQCLEFPNGIVARLHVRRGKARVQVDTRRRKPKAA